MIARRRARATGAVVAFVLVLAAAAWWWTHRSTAAPAPSAATAAPNVPLATVARGSLAVTVAATGRVGPPAGSEAKLAFPVSGIVASVDVRVGERVAAGEPLAALVAGGFRDAAAAARADLAASSANAGGGAIGATSVALANAKLDGATARLALLERGGPAASSDRIAAEGAARQAAIKLATDGAALARAQTLYAGGVVALKEVQLATALVASDVADERTADARVVASAACFRASLDAARADVAQARSDVAAARAQAGNVAALAEAASAKLAAADRDVAGTVLRAPSDGVVTQILKHAGEAVDPTTPALAIAPPYDREVTLAVPIGIATRITAGDPATLALRAPRRSGSGTVRAVVPAGDATTQNATVVVDGLPPGALAGESVAATIVVAHVAGLVVPLSAIVTDPQTGRTVVFVRSTARDAAFISRDVTVAADDGDRAVIRGDVRAGDRIAAQGAYTLLAPSA